MAPPEMVFQFKIILLGIYPIIWRRILIPTSATFGDLHFAIQSVFNWDAGSLPHQFRCADGGFTSFIKPPPLTDNNKICRHEGFLSWNHLIAKSHKKTSAYVKYTYNIGEKWELSIELEDIVPAMSTLTYPICIAGKRNAPPRDCQSIEGYETLIDVFSGFYDDCMGSQIWIEQMKVRPFDPDFFHPALVRFAKPMKRRTRRRKENPAG
jgi:hypothetical protein